jgi:hypothetical protein
MDTRFNRHYTRAEARALLPCVEKWLDELIALRGKMSRHDEQMVDLLALGQDVGGPPVKDWLTTLSAMKDILHAFQSREIQIKDLERGLVDFPAFHEGREVYLCWERGEEDIEFWHELDTGYGGRERL